MRKSMATGAVIALTVLLVGCASEAPSSAPESTEPTPVTLASGSRTADLGSWGQAFDIQATGTGDDVSGTMEVSGGEGSWSVDLQCSRATDDGILVIGGEVSESTNPIASEGAYAAILLHLARRCGRCSGSTMTPRPRPAAQRYPACSAIPSSSR